MLLSDSKWETSQNSSQTKNKSKQEAESRISIYGLQVTCKVDFIRDFISSGAVVQTQLQLNKSSLSFEGMHCIIHSWTRKFSQGQIGFASCNHVGVVFIDSLTYWNQSRVQTIKSNLDLSTKQSYPQSCCPPRVDAIEAKLGLSKA